MAAVNSAVNGEPTSHDKTYSKPLENGLLPAVAEKLELEETGAIVDGKTETEEEFEDEEPPVGEIKVRSLIMIIIFNIKFNTFASSNRFVYLLVPCISWMLPGLHLLV